MNVSFRTFACSNLRPCPLPSNGGAAGTVAHLAVVFLLGAGGVALGPESSAAQEASGHDHAVDPSLFESLDYRMVGPFRGGRSTAVAGVPDRPDTFLQGTTGGGIWRTEDSGVSWTNISDGQIDVGSIGAVTVAPSDPSVVYVGSGSACVRGNISAGKGMYRSLDGGDTWEFAGLPEAGQIGAVVVHPRDPDLVYVAALGHIFGPNPERGVYRSRDGGDTWENVLFLNDSTGAVDLAMNPRNPREIYSGMWRAERKPWTMISGGEDGGVYKTVDGGDTWQKLGGGLPEGLVGRVGVTVSPANPDRVWALVEAEPGGGVYRSDDRGETWTRTNSENKLRQRAWYYTHIEADPVDPNTVYALNTGFYRSVDGGETFENIPVPHGDVHDLWVHPTDADRMVVANDGGAQVSLNGGASFSTMNNQPTAEFYDVTVDNGFPYRLYGAQQDNTGISLPSWSSSTTLHPFQHWSYPSACETGPIAFHPDSPDVVYGGCYGGAINRLEVEKDQRRNVILYPQLQLGQAAEDLRFRFQWVAPIVVSPHDPEVVYHASQYVHRTTDGGHSWETISPDLTTNNPAHQERAGEPINADVTGVEIYNTIFSLVVSPHDPQTLWAGSDDGRVHVTRDGGENWQEITPPGMPELGTVDEIEVSSHRPGKAYLAVHRYRLDDFRPYVFRTEDYGSSWELLTDGTNGVPDDHPTRTVREDPDREGLLYAGTEFGVFVSFDDGARWQPLQLDLPVTPITGMRVHRKDLVLATQGRSFWILDDLSPLHDLASGTDSDAAQSPAWLYPPRDVHRVDKSGVGGIGAAFAPEPAPNGALFQYHLAEAPGEGEEVTLEILDAAGRRVRLFTSDSTEAAEANEPRLPAEAGGNRFVWDLTYPGPDPIEDAVVWGYTGGVKAPPGPYTVRLEARGSVSERSFRLLADPRLDDVAQEDYEEQFRLGSAVRDTVNQVYDALRQVESVREQVDQAVERAARLERAEELQGRADSLKEQLSGVEEELIQTRNESGQDPIRFPSKLDNQYLELYGNVTGTDGYISGGPEGRPTEGAYTRFDDLNEEWAELRDRLQAILRESVEAFNRELDRLGVPGIAVPEGPPAISLSR